MAIEEGSTNACADLGRHDTDEMLVMAPLATKVGEAIKRRRPTLSSSVCRPFFHRGASRATAISFSRLRTCVRS